MKNNWKEKFWKKFEENRFIQSTDSVTDEIQEIDGYVTDMEAIIKLRGEFDKYAIEDFIESILEEQKKELIEEIITMIPEHQKPITNKRYSEIVKNNPHTPKIDFFLGENIGRNGFRQSMYILLRKYAEDNGVSLKDHD